MKEKVILNHNGKKITLSLKKANFLRKGFGLMFCPRKRASALLFDFKKPVDFILTSLFVFFSFIAIWIGEDGKVIEIKVIKPFRSSIKSPKNFKRLIEIPINKKYGEVLELLVDN